jgi:hypothetical protein
LSKGHSGLNKNYLNFIPLKGVYKEAIVGTGMDNMTKSSTVYASSYLDPLLVFFQD